jgi:hypothetical protein
VDEILTDSIVVVKGLEIDELIIIIIERVILLRALNFFRLDFSLFLTRRFWVFLIKALKYYRAVREYLL